MFIDGVLAGKTYFDAYLDADYYPGRDRIESGEKSRNAAYVRAHELRHKEHIDLIIKEKLNQLVMSKEEALARQSALGRFNMGEVLEVDPLVCPHCEQAVYEEGEARINVKKLKDYNLAHLIKKISYDRQGRQIIEFRDVDASQERLLKAHGAFVTEPEKEMGGLATLMAKALERKAGAGSN